MKENKTRTLLLEAAEKVLLSDGWESLSIRKLGSAAGLSYAALYRHFSGMEDLRKALVERQYLGFLAYLAQIRSAGESEKVGPEVPGVSGARSSLLSSCMAYLGYWAGRPRHFQLYREWVAEAGALGWKDEPSPEPLARDLAAWKGLSPQSLPVRRGVWVLQAGLFGLAMASQAELAAGKGFDAARYRDALDLMLEGLPG